VQIDEAWSDNAIFAVDDTRRSGDLELADGDDLVAFDGDVADKGFAAAAVVQSASAEDEIGGDGVGGDERNREENRCGHGGGGEKA
jgi:hypothetical protein